MMQREIKAYGLHPSRRRLGTLAAAVMLAAGVSACDSGPETRDPVVVPAIEPDPQLGAQSDDVDIDIRSTEATLDQENPSAAGPPADGDLELAGGQELNLNDPETGDASGSEQIAAVGSNQAVSAFAVLEPTEGNDARGDASFIETEDGLEIVITMTGLEPGQHGIHVHENADCSGPTASGAGDHFSPEGNPHGAPTDEASQRHAGDLGNISADASGEAELNMTVEGLQVEGAQGVAGRAVIVHSGEDDFSTQPDGAAGDPVSCGEIEVRARG